MKKLKLEAVLAEVKKEVPGAFVNQIAETLLVLANPGILVSPEKVIVIENYVRDIQATIHPGDRLAPMHMPCATWLNTLRN